MLLLDMRHNLPPESDSVGVCPPPPLSALDQLWADINLVLTRKPVPPPHSTQPLADEGPNPDGVAASHTFLADDTADPCRLLDNPETMGSNPFFRLWMTTSLAPLLDLDSSGSRSPSLMSPEEKKRTVMVMLENCLKPILEQMESGKNSEVRLIFFRYLNLKRLH